LISFITAPILHDPVNSAPGSIDNLFVMISPFNFAEVFNDSNCETVILAFIVPEISAVLHSISPSMIPSLPRTTLPSVITDPFNVPSTLISPF